MQLSPPPHCTVTALCTACTVAYILSHRGDCAVDFIGIKFNNDDNYRNFIWEIFNISFISDLGVSETVEMETKDTRLGGWYE